MNDSYIKIKLAIENAQQIAIFSHVSPDGDAIASSLALKIAIELNFKKHVIVFASQEVPEIYNFLPDSESVRCFSKKNDNFEFDLAIAVDTATKERLKYAEDVFFKAKTTMNIDHHKTNPGYADINVIDHKCASSTMLLFKIFNSLNLTVDNKIASCLYAGLIADTGCFKYSNVDKAVFETAKNLTSYKIDIKNIAYNCFLKKSQKALKLQSYVILNSKFALNDKVVYSIISLEDMKKFEAKNEHTDGIVEELRKFDTCEVAILLKENENNTSKISMRSKEVDVAKVAEKFSGGGHKNASGLTIACKPEVAVKKLLEELEKCI